MDKVIEAIQRSVDEKALLEWNKEICRRLSLLRQKANIEAKVNLAVRDKVTFKDRKGNVIEGTINEIKSTKAVVEVKPSIRGIISGRWRVPLYMLTKVS